MIAFIFESRKKLRERLHIYIFKIRNQTKKYQIVNSNNLTSLNGIKRLPKIKPRWI